MSGDLKFWESYFALDTVGNLRRFIADLDMSIPEQAALAYYASTWPMFSEANDGEAFAPAVKLSHDRSAIMYGNAPVIFEGTNHWSWKVYFSTEELSRKLADLGNVVTELRQSNPYARMSLVLIPEKDNVISLFLLKEGRFRRFEEAIVGLKERMATLGIQVVYNQPFIGIDKFQVLSDFEYKDSHLDGRNYVTVFGFVLETLGVPWANVKHAIDLKRLPEFGDLAAKFENGQPTQTLTFQPDVANGDVAQAAGTESFADPLSKTWQEFRNAAPLVDQSVCLLGDSHCSIFSQRKLTYLFANTFRETHFEWNPCGIRKKPDLATYDNIVLEISSRFAV